MKKSRVLKLVVHCCLGIFLFSSCHNELEDQSFINLQDEYELIIAQELSEAGGVAALQIRTIQELECSNYIIPYQLDLNQEDIKLILNKASLEDQCVFPGGYITSQLNLDFHNAEKYISILIQNIIDNSGTIIATDDHIHLELSSNYGLKISKAKINRIKIGMMWGHVHNGTQNSINRIHELFVSIDNGKPLLPGDYGLFYVSNTADIQIYDSGSNQNHTYAMFSDSTYESIHNEILQIKESDPSLVFNMTLFDGKTINVE